MRWDGDEEQAAWDDSGAWTVEVAMLRRIVASRTASVRSLPSGSPFCRPDVLGACDHDNGEFHNIPYVLVYGTSKVIATELIVA